MRKQFRSMLNLVLVTSMLLAMFAVPAMAAPELPPVMPLVTKEASTYIVVFEDPAVPAYNGGVAGYQATSIAATGAAKLNVNAPAALAYRNYLRAQQAEFMVAAEKTVGHELAVRFQYQLSLNGMAVELTSAEALALSKMAGVVDVVADWTEYAQTDVGPDWVEADKVWAGVGDFMGTKGEGMVIGIVDTGINYDHPSFSDAPAVW